MALGKAFKSLDAPKRSECLPIFVVTVVLSIMSMLRTEDDTFKTEEKQNKNGTTKKESIDWCCWIGFVLFLSIVIIWNRSGTIKHRKTLEQTSWLGFKFIVLVTHAYERDQTKKEKKHENYILSSLFYS